MLNYTAQERARYKSTFGKEIPQPPCEVHFRPATLDDELAIKEQLGGYFGGMDYLPSLYSLYLCEQDKEERLIFVATKDNKVVAVYMTQVVDNGTTMVLGGARVDPALLGTGINGALGAYSLTRTLSTRAGAKIVKMRGSSRISEKWSKALSKISARSRRPVLTQEAYVIQPINIAAFRHLYYSNTIHHKYAESENVHFVDEHEMFVLLSDKATTKRLFPGHVFQAGPDSYAPMVENITALYRYKRAFLTDRNNHIFTTMAFWQCKIGTMVDVKLYGVANLSLAMAHLLKVFTKVSVECSMGDVTVLMGVQEKTGQPGLSAELQKIGLKTDDSKQEFSKIITWEEAVSGPVASL